jgi:hypothetical protein
VKAVRDRAAFTTAAAESTHLQRMMIEENLVVTQMVIIPNHAPATNQNKNLTQKSPNCVR